MQKMNNIINLDKTKKKKRLKQANILKEIRTILKRLFDEDKKNKLIDQKRKETIKTVKYFLVKELVKTL